MELIYITLAVYGMGAATALFPKKWRWQHITVRFWQQYLAAELCCISQRLI